MSIQRISERLGIDSAGDDAGLSITEVIVAIMVFTIVILGLAYSLATMTRLVADDKNREVAVGLAAQEIDEVRAVGDASKVVSDTDQTQTVGSTTYKISRETEWVNTDGSSGTCGGVGGNLQYKRVSVEVTWANMLTLKNAVRSDTIIAPATRINDPSFGTIMVSVLGADGTGRSGVTVTATKTNLGGPVGAIPATDSDGCSYILKVTPGTYNVGVSKTGYIDNNQVASPVQSVTIAAGSSQTANFAYDAAAKYTLKYASNFTLAGVTLPSGLTTNFITSAGTYTPSTAPTQGSVINLYPVTEGYAAIAGKYVSTATTTSGCLSVDPAAWVAGSVNGVAMADGARPPVGVAAGGSVILPIAMGVIKVTTGSSAATLTAKGVAAPAGTGDPGCAQPTTYTFSSVARNTTVYIAVPFGSWQVTGSSSLAAVVPATTGELTGTGTGATVTLDPRNPS